MPQSNAPRQDQRPSWDEYFLGLVAEVSTRATCDRGRNGCLVVRDRRIIATGYVGSPPGQPHCDEAGHQLKHLRDETGLTTTHCLRTIHAELNAICQAARYGIALEETTLYTKMEPCRTCAAAIVAVGISRVVASRGYHAASEARELLKAAGVQLEVFEDRVEQYELQREDAAGTGSDR